ncbi:MAG TPA: hypothetical protein VFX59_29270 [Polyangiales bacterium]|nr:hypothetical protein [Polyangiales bacterium]
MARPAPLPLPIDQVPQSIRKFCDPAAPLPARMMAARGMVPVKGGEQVMLLLQLSADADPTLGKSANEALGKLPEAVLLPVTESALLPSFLDRLAEHFREREDVLERLAANPALAGGTLEWIALRCSERVSERISVNEQRLLAEPRVIEALYKNKNTRMSTADRLIDLAARNHVVLDIPTYEAHVAAIKGQLIPEPSDEPLPSDQDFAQALVEDDDDPEAVAPTEDPEAAEDQVKEKFLPLMMRIRNMTSSEKLRLAMVGNSSARAFLVRDKDKTVAFAAISSPAMQAAEVIPILRSKEVGEDVIRYVGNKREWTKSHEVKHALVFNPKSPVGISLRFIGHLRDDELKTLSRSRNVSQPLKSAALQKIAAKEKKDRGER